jgi:hypothetical protein
MRQRSTEQPSTDLPTIPGDDPAEGPPAMDLPGADRPEPRPEPPNAPDAPDAPETERPERLGERIEHGLGAGIASGEPDLVPDVEVPEETM